MVRNTVDPRSMLILVEPNIVFLLLTTALQEIPSTRDYGSTIKLQPVPKTNLSALILESDNDSRSGYPRAERAKNRHRIGNY